jgi:hypothetical protein
MKSRIIFLFILFIILSSVAYAQLPPVDMNITNYITPEYRMIPGSRLNMKLPQGFVANPEGYGYIDSKRGAAITITEERTTIDSTLRLFDLSFDSTGSDSHGSKIDSRWPLVINGEKAQLVSLRTKDESGERNEGRLFIGDSSRTYVVSASAPVMKNDELPKELREALLSVVYDPTQRPLAPGDDGTTTGSTPCKCNEKK